LNGDALRDHTGREMYINNFSQKKLKKEIIGSKQVKLRGRTLTVVLIRENVAVQTEFAVLGFGTDDKHF
jgi:hypothetical protein